jgi:hypothetical protein
MQYWNTTTFKSTLFFLFLFSQLAVFSQENSPYSRYGLGNLKPIENIANRGMGGVSIADDNPLIANPSNPATYTGLRLTSYQVGVEGSSVKIKNATDAYRTGYTVLSYVNIGFAASKKLGLSFGLLPQTRSKYNMEQIDSLPFSKVLNSYYGGGGVQKIYVGAAYKMGDFSIGVNTGYTFGNLINTSDNKFVDSLKIFSNSVTTRTTMGGVFWQVGGLMNKKINDDYTIKLGATYTGSQTLNAKKEGYWNTFIGDVTDPLYSKNVDSINNVKGKIKLPSHLAVGAIIANGDFWQLGADFISSDWTKYSYYGNADSMTKSWTLKLGGSITPDVNAVNNYWKKVTYRVGAYTGKDNLQFNGTTFSKMGVTAGIGYPIRRTNLSIGQINASLDIGKRGTTENGLLREGYTRFAVGFTFNDKWFVKRRYD